MFISFFKFENHVWPKLVPSIGKKSPNFNPLSPFMTCWLGDIDVAKDRRKFGSKVGWLLKMLLCNFNIYSYNISMYGFSISVPMHSHPPLDAVWDPDQVGPTPHPTVDGNASARRPRNHTYKYHFCNIYVTRFIQMDLHFIIQKHCVIVCIHRMISVMKIICLWVSERTVCVSEKFCCMFGCTLPSLKQGFRYTTVILSIFHLICFPFVPLSTRIIGCKINFDLKQCNVDSMEKQPHLWWNLNSQR